MKITTTDGKEYYITENCPYYQTNTAGQHSIGCPNYQPPCQYLVIQSGKLQSSQLLKYPSMTIMAIS